MFLVSLEGVKFKIDTEARLGEWGRVKDYDLERYRSAIYQLLYDLHPFEASLLYLYLFKKKSQDQIAELFGITQGAVSGRLSKAVKRLRFLGNLPALSRSVVEAVISEFIHKPVWVRVVLLMIDQTSHAAVARILNISQGGVRQMFLASLERLEGVLKQMEEGWTFFPSRKLIKVYMLAEKKNEDELVHSEIMDWVRDRLRQIVELLHKVKNNYSILSMGKFKAPKITVLDLS